MAAPGSSLWLLEAKPFATEERSEKATTVKFWLRPGTVIVVGRQGSDVPVEEDKSISRKHAEITVLPAKEWRQEGGAPCVVVKDLSKYGTIISPSGTFEEAPLSGASGRALPNCMLRFGFKSPFKLYHQVQDWVLYLSPEQQQAADPDTLAAVQAAAAATGLPLMDELPKHRGTRVLALAAAPLRIDGTLLLALLRRYPIVGASWLLEWQQQRVWCNSRPQEESYPVPLQYSDTAGRVKALPSQAAVLQAAEQQLLGGRTLLWLPPARDEALQEAARLLGSANVDVAAAGRAPAAAKVAGAVLIRGGEADAGPAAYRQLPWTTPALLLAGMLEASLDSAVHLPAEEPDTTPLGAKKGGKGRGGSGGGSGSGSGSKAAPGSRSTATAGGKGKGRAGARGGKAGDSQQQDSGSETEVSEDASHLRGTLRVLAAEVSKPSPRSAAAAAAPPASPQDPARHGGGVSVAAGAAAAGQAASPRRHGRKVAVGVAAAVAAAASPGQADASQGAAVGGRKRRQPEQQQQQQQQEEEEEEPQPAAAKKQRQGAPTAAAAAPAPPPLLDMPAAEGWLTKQHNHSDEPASPGSSDISPAGRQPVRPPAAAAAAASVAKSVPAGAGGSLARRGARATSAAAAAAAEAGREMAGGQEEGEEVEEAGEEGGGAAVLAYLPLVVARPAPAAASAPGGRGRGGGRSSIANFKAFRKGGDGGVAAAVGRRVVGYDAEPYLADGPVNADAFLRAEAQRRQRRQQADELFSANVKARNAAQLPDPDEDTPPKGRGRGAKKAKSPADGSQQSMLNFLPAASGRGRGRSGGGRAGAGSGRGRGRGRG